ncbi:MAG: transposase [Chloroflexi bacterium]|nr:transposase [Chloroflexota bacterium]
MPYAPNHKHRRSIRAQGYDYTQAGGYFVTICTHNRASLFGAIVDGVMRPNAAGTVAADSWAWLATQYPYVMLDEWIIMPNHLHAIIVLDDVMPGGSRAAPTASSPVIRKPLGQLVGAFKTVSAKQINGQRNTPGAPVWQRNYYEHIIRNDKELNAIRRYVADNPAQWALDRENPERPAT